MWIIKNYNSYEVTNIKMIDKNDKPTYNKKDKHVKN